ncbi:uncharacterized protein [Aphelocoma coerulescens]|uniref:uncharacterized protein n=1 Tax=Aphelocoma coerulescens TaxID=39617 RepID=UPI003604A9D1
MDAAFLFPQGGQEVARSKAAPPQAAAGTAATHRPARVQQQNDLQQPGRLPGAKAAEPTAGGAAGARGHAGREQAEMHQEHKSGAVGREDNEPQAESDLDAPPSLPATRQGDGEEVTVLEAQRTEVMAAAQSLAQRVPERRAVCHGAKELLCLLLTAQLCSLWPSSLPSFRPSVLSWSDLMLYSLSGLHYAQKLVYIPFYAFKLSLSRERRKKTLKDADRDSTLSFSAFFFFFWLLCSAAGRVGAEKGPCLLVQPFFFFLFFPSRELNFVFPGIFDFFPFSAGLLQYQNTAGGVSTEHRGPGPGPSPSSEEEGDQREDSKIFPAPPALSPNTQQSSPESLAKAEALTSLSVSGRLVGCQPQEEKKRRKRERAEAWPVDREYQLEKKRRRTHQRRLEKRRKLRQPKKPRLWAGSRARPGRAKQHIQPLVLAAHN